MARRKSNGGSALIILAVVVGLPIWIIAKANDYLGGGVLVAISALILGLIVFYFVRKRAARFAYLRAKYGDEIIVQKIMHGKLWQGQTSDQLLDAAGDPPSKDLNLLKTRKREIWKYHPSGKGRYRTRITLDDDVVIEIKMLGS